MEAWEGKAYAYGLQSLHEMGCPVEGLRFDRSLVIRGLIMDTGAALSWRRGGGQMAGWWAAGKTAWFGAWFGGRGGC